MSYKSLLRRHGLSWVTEHNENVAVYHVISAIRPDAFRAHPELDLEISRYDLPKDFRGFMKHAIELSEAFQIVDNGPPLPTTRTKKTKVFEIRRYKNDRADNEKPNKKRSVNSATDTKQSAPVCLWSLHKSKDIRHFLRDCRACPDHEMETLMKQFRGEKIATGPAKNTRPQAERTEAAVKVGNKAVGHITTVPHQNCSSFEVASMNNKESYTANRRADDGADESVVPSGIAEHAVFNGIGRMRKIVRARLQVALKDCNEAQILTWARIWTAPRIVLKLTAELHVLLNVEFLNADAELAAEDLLIGLPALRHLGVDTKTLLENRRDSLHVYDCASVKYGANDKKER